MNSEVIIISGPTAAGKSQKALSLAKEIDAEIISCDSIQVYRNMDIGSAKPSQAELLEVPHHLINVCDANIQFNVGDYILYAKKALKEIQKKGKRTIVVGGSGFYLKAWFSAVTDEIEIPSNIKTEVEKLAQKENVMLAKLLELDPNAAKIIDIQNPRRIRPALERIMASGLSLSELKNKFSSLPCPMGDFQKTFIMQDLQDPELFERAKHRIDKMLAQGLIAETRKLLELGIERNASASSAIGYRETISAIKSGNFENLSEEIYKNTVALIKKQRKFFKNALFKTS